VCTTDDARAVVLGAISLYNAVGISQVKIASGMAHTTSEMSYFPMSPNSFILDVIHVRSATPVNLLTTTAQTELWDVAGPLLGPAARSGASWRRPMESGLTRTAYAWTNSQAFGH